MPKICKLFHFQRDFLCGEGHIPHLVAHRLCIIFLDRYCRSAPHHLHEKTKRSVFVYVLCVQCMYQFVAGWFNEEEAGDERWSK